MVKQNQQIFEQKNTVEKKDRRFAKGMVVAISCEIIRLDNEEKETYKVQSESDINKYYIVKFIDGTPVFCSCKDFEIQVKNNEKHLCKHMRAIVLEENYGLVTRQNSHNPAKFEKATIVSRPKSYRDDDYTF